MTMSRLIRIVTVTAMLLASCSGSSDLATTTTADTTRTVAPTTTPPQATLSVTTALPPARSATWFDGVFDSTCINDVFTDAGEFDFSVPPLLVDCNEPRDNEVLSTVELADGEFPSDETLSAQMKSLCIEDLVAFLGRSPDESGLTTPWIVLPDKEDWDAGVPTAFVLCSPLSLLWEQLPVET